MPPGAELRRWLAAVAEGAAWVVDRWRDEGDPESVAFDRAHGVDTARWTLDYEPVPPSVCEAALRALPPEAHATHFVDLGCGKGRALMLASRHPFRAVTGVECVRGLVQTCQANLDAWTDRHPRCGPVTVLHCDVLDFVLPRGDLTLFLYNPFGADTLRAVLDRVEAGPGRRVYAAYVNPLEAALFDASRWRRLDEGGLGPRAWHVYARRPAI